MAWFFFFFFDKGEGLYQLVLHQLQCLILEASFHFDLWYGCKKQNVSACLWHGLFEVNPFTATTCKISGLKSARACTCRWYIWWSYNKSTFNIEQFYRNPFMYSCEEEKNLKCFQIWHAYRSFSAWWRSKRGSERVKRNTQVGVTSFIQSSRAAWKSRWPSWAPPSLTVLMVSVDVKPHAAEPLYQCCGQGHKGFLGAYCCGILNWTVVEYIYI